MGHFVKGHSLEDEELDVKADDTHRLLISSSRSLVEFLIWTLPALKATSLENRNPTKHLSCFQTLGAKNRKFQVKAQYLKSHVYLSA